jgi:hypothetical protein
MLPWYMQCAGQSLAAAAAAGDGSPEEALRCLQLLSDACEAPAPLLGPHLPAVVGLAADVAGARALDLQARDQALELLAVLAA